MASRKEWCDQENRTPRNMSQSPKENETKKNTPNVNDSTVNTLINKLQFLSLGETVRATKQRFNFQIWTTPLKSIENVKSDSEDDAWSTPPNGCITTETDEKSADLLTSEKWKCSKGRLSFTSENDSVVSNVTTPGWFNGLVAESDLDFFKNVDADETIVLSSDNVADVNAICNNIDGIDSLDKTRNDDIENICRLEERNVHGPAQAPDEDIFIDCTEELNSTEKPHEFVMNSNSEDVLYVSHQLLTVDQETVAPALKMEFEPVKEGNINDTRQLKNSANSECPIETTTETLLEHTGHRRLHETEPAEAESFISELDKEVRTQIVDSVNLNHIMGELSPSSKESPNEDVITPVNELSSENISESFNDNYGPSASMFEHSNSTVSYENMEESLKCQRKALHDLEASSNIVALIDGNIPELVTELLDGAKKEPEFVPYQESYLGNISEDKMVLDECLNSEHFRMKPCPIDVKLTLTKTVADHSEIMDEPPSTTKENELTKTKTVTNIHSEIMDEPPSTTKENKLPKTLPSAKELTIHRPDELNHYQVPNDPLVPSVNKAPPAYPYIRITTPFKKNIYVRVPVSPEESDFTKKRDELLKCDKELSKEKSVTENVGDKPSVKKLDDLMILGDTFEVTCKSAQEEESLRKEDSMMPSKRLTKDLPIFDVFSMDYESRKTAISFTDTDSSKTDSGVIGHGKVRAYLPYSSTFAISTGNRIVGFDKVTDSVIVVSGIHSLVSLNIRLPTPDDSGEVNTNRSCFTMSFELMLTSIHNKRQGCQTISNTPQPKPILFKRKLLWCQNLIKNKMKPDISKN